MGNFFTRSQSTHTSSETRGRSDNDASDVYMRLLVCPPVNHRKDRVGCTCLIGRFCKGFWGDTITWEPLTTAVTPDYMWRSVRLNDRRIRLQVFQLEKPWQIHVQVSDYAQLNTICGRSFGRSNGIVFAYSVANRHSWEQTKEFIEESKKNDLLSDLSSEVYQSTTKKVLLVGTKCDLTDKREVDYVSAKEFADENGLLFFEVSAKDGTNVELAFMTLVADILGSATSPK